ncbi:MAG: hypothetical protein HKN68_20350, partial [Saprospiraceae bacterium]|nr:hypothetical protein [Saprospiraceae bacterium]
DLPPVKIIKETIDILESEIGENPIHTYKKLTQLRGVKHDNAMVLIDNRLMLNLFNKLNIQGFDPREIAQLIVNKIASHDDYSKVDFEVEEDKVNRLASFMSLIKNNKVSKSAAYNQLFDKMWEDMKTPLIKMAENLHILKEEDQSFLGVIAQEIVDAFPDKVKAYHNGKKGLIGFFMGQAMKKSRGKADPKLLQKEIEALLKS